MRPANDVLRFTLELCLLAALAVWGFDAGDGALGWVLGLGAPLLVAVVWGTFMSPKASHPLTDPIRIVAEVVIFATGVAGLAASDHGALAIGFAAAVAVHLALTFPLGQRTPAAAA